MKSRLQLKPAKLQPLSLWCDRHHKQHLEKAVPPFDGWRDRRANADSTVEFLFSLEGRHHTRECSQQARARAPAEVR